MAHIEEVVDNPHGAELQQFEKLNWLGREMEDQQAKDIAYGVIDPNTFEAFPVHDNEMAIIYKVLKRQNPNKVQQQSNNIFAKSSFGK